jgi:hypothetical protein
VHLQPDRECDDRDDNRTPTTGEIFFELPLRGESLAAWLNSVFIT